MTLPVSSYEELLHRVRSLTHETRQLQRQIDAPLIDCNDNDGHLNSWRNGVEEGNFKFGSERISALDPGLTHSPPEPTINDKDVGSRWTKEQGASPEAKEQEELSSHENERMKMIGPHGTMCHSTTTVNTQQSVVNNDTSGGGLSYSYSYSSEQLGTKVEMVYNLLSMLGTHDRSEMISTLLAMSSSPDSCRAMRQSGCLSLLVQLVHAGGESELTRERAAQALRNMVLCHGDDKRGRREARVLRLLEQITTHCDTVKADVKMHTEEAHPGPAIAALMKLSFDEEHRLAMCQLGVLYVIARIIQVESGCKLKCCITVRRYAGMALTNLTFGDGNNKALLCSMKSFMTALVAQLSTTSEDLTQVTASVLRNLSWRADAASKQSLREVGAVPALMRAAMSATKEPTLKSVLSALWNLSAHCNINKVDICNVDGAIQYLVLMLNYQSASKTLAIVENAGGILRNISSHIALREDYRKILREHNCLPILLRQLQSASLTVVSNACGTLWNLSARCASDQRALVALGAVPMLSSLAHSRHRMIAMGASAALKNLLPVRLQQQQDQHPSGGATLLVRKRRALEAELNSSLSETCDNIEPGPSWEANKTITTSQVKEECEQINHSMQQMTLDETPEQPVDYSLKYCETESKGTSDENDQNSYSIKYPEPETDDKKVFNGCYTEEGTTGGDYAETDLDQLTDYSLRYNEEHQDSSNSSFNKCEDVEKRPPETVIAAEASPGKNDSGKAGNLETPLMFSRCSSLGSLSSCEQHDDCQSSVVSEFSRMTSGIMSPSDLPDSPTQTVPPSPRTKAPPPIPSAVVEEEKPNTGGVFDDTVVAFKEESTPAQFSTATSLSDLTFDEESHDVGCERKELELAAVSEEDDEHMLADCISIGMQNNRDRLDAGNTAAHKRINVRSSGIPVKASVVRQQLVRVGGVEETPVQFCTEDTPASLSHATSHSELSELISCALSDGGSSDHDNMLAECIQSGMPQPHTALPGGGAHVTKKIPKIQTVVPGVKVSVAKPRSIAVPTSRMRQLVAEDEVSVFATEGSPGNFSVRSSLSDLTVNSRPDKTGPETPPLQENPSPLSSLDPDVSVDEGEVVTVLSGTSADDVTLADQEDQALLMQVISSGMPSVDKMKDSSDTWAEDTPNDISFPSLSLTAPVVQSFHSEKEVVTSPNDSQVIPLERGRVAIISHLEMEESASYIGLDGVLPPSNMASILSLNSSVSMAPDKHSITNAVDNSSYQDLENVQPPSTMDSILSMTFSGSAAIAATKVQPIRDLIQSGQQGGGGSLLENVRPPADMDELLDLENSILSVASLCSEVADEEEDEEDATEVGEELSNAPTATPVMPVSPHHPLPSMSPHSPMSPPSPAANYRNQRITVKQRREIAGKNRFNTYVIKPEENKETPVKEVEETYPTENKEKSKEKITPKQRRQADRERFRTRTIHDAPTHVERLSSVESGETSPLESPDCNSEQDLPPRPIVVKPPEVKTVRGGAKSSIPVVRSPVKIQVALAQPKKKPPAVASPPVSAQTPTSPAPTTTGPPPLQRQGTFTKDEPVGSSIPLPVKKTASPLRKTPTNKTSGSSGIAVGRGRAASLPNKTGSGGGVRVSVSNQSLKSACGGAGGGGGSSGDSTGSTRWHSNSSLNSTQQPKSKETVSKIASLWKKVDDSKKKQQQQAGGKDSRVWIPAEPRHRQMT